MKRQSKQSGFTLIEMLIATTLFALFLFLVSAMIIRIGRLYSKGIITSKTQEAAQSISSAIGRSIQFSSSSGIATDNATYICADSQRYTFVKGKQLTDSATLGTDQANHVLIKDSLTGCSGAFTGVFDPVTQREMMPPHMRLADLSVNPVAGAAGAYAIKVRVVYGDIDLVCSLTVGPGDCTTNTSPTTGWANPDLACKSGNTAGTEFCAVSELTTTVQKRL